MRQLGGWMIAVTLAVANIAHAQDINYDQTPAPPPPPPPAQPSVREPELAPPPPPPPILIPAPGTTPTTWAEMPKIPLAGYANGSFFIRDPHDWFVIFPRGRLQIDWFNFPARDDPPPGVAPNSARDPRPKGTLFVRRARAEMQGTFLGHFDFHIAGEFATLPPTGGYAGSLADAYIIVDYFSFLKLQAGQFDLPFMLENRTTDKFIDFMERSVPVRAFGVPSNKDSGAFIFGWLPKKVAYYSIGVIDGVAQSVKAQDNFGAIVGRAFVAPLAPIAGKHRWVEDIWVGASWWYKHNNNLGAQAAPSQGAAQNDLPSMTTQGGVTFFSSNYNLTNPAIDRTNTIREHLVPWGTQLKWAVEANVPLFRKINLRFELVHQSVDLAAYYDLVNPPNAPTGTGAIKWNGQPLVRGSTGASAPAQHGLLEGTSYYVQASYWILGDVNFLETPGLETAPKIKQFAVAAEPKWALMVTAKFEHTDFNVTDLPSIMAAGGTTTLDPGVGNYDLKTFEVGVNAWGTKHVRLTANYLFNYLDGTTDGDTNNVQAAANAKSNFYFRKFEHELLFRLAVAL
jgi:phosphate-selective porin